MVRVRMILEIVGRAVRMKKANDEGPSEIPREINPQGKSLWPGKPALERPS
jgi:hypothetical protein